MFWPYSETKQNIYCEGHYYIIFTIQHKKKVNQFLRMVKAVNENQQENKQYTLWSLINKGKEMTARL